MLLNSNSVILTWKMLISLERRLRDADAATTPTVPRVKANSLDLVLARDIGDELISVRLCSGQADRARREIEHKGEGRRFERMDSRSRHAFAGRESFELRQVRLIQQPVRSLIFTGNRGTAPRGTIIRDRPAKY